MAGDAAHLNPPAGGFGLNTGMGDVVDLGWKISAALAAGAEPKLLGSYEAERRPIALRNVRQSTENHLRSMELKIDPAIGEDSAAGARARQELGDHLRRIQGRTFITDGTALGYIYSGSPIVCDDGSHAARRHDHGVSSDDASRRPRAARVARARTLDHRSRSATRFVLLRFGGMPPDPDGVRRGVCRTRRAARDRVDRRSGHRAALRTQTRARASRRTRRVARRRSAPRSARASSTSCAERPDVRRARLLALATAAPIALQRSYAGAQSAPIRVGAATDRRARAAVLRGKNSAISNAPASTSR